MTDKPRSAHCGQRMIDDMTARRIKEKVQKRLRAASSEPSRAISWPLAGHRHAAEDLRRFQVHSWRSCRSAIATINAAIAALRFFFNVTDRTARPRPSSDDREHTA